MSTQIPERRLRRRDLAGLAAGGLATAGVYALTKGNGNSNASTAARQAPDCVLTPELTDRAARRRWCGCAGGARATACAVP